MTAFIIVMLTAIFLLLVVWIWIRLHRKHRRQSESFAGKSTVSELLSKERRKK